FDRTNAYVDAHLVAATAAEQLVDRHTERLTLQIPQGLLNAADGRGNHRPTWVARAVIHEPPEVLDPMGILTDQPLLEVTDGLDGRLVRTDTVRLPRAVQVVVGQNAQEDSILAPNVHEKSLDVSDLHGGSGSRGGGARVRRLERPVNATA